jgi:hypothetical protein
VNIAPHRARRLPRPLPPRPLSPRQELHSQQVTSHQSRPSPSRTNFAERIGVTSAISFTFFHLPALELSCLSFSYPRPLFSIVCGPFTKTPGVPYPFPIFASHRSRIRGHVRRAQNRKNAHPQVLCLPLLQTPCRVSPFPATLTQTPGMVVSRFLQFSSRGLNASVTPLESALTKTPQGWVPPSRRGIAMLRRAGRER